MLPRCAVSVCHVLMLVLYLSAAEEFDWTKNNHGSFYYGTFPAGFSWGAGSSAYQTEGAWDKDGKGLSIWDVFSHKKGKIQQNETGDSSCEGYYKIKDDVSLIKELKLNHYRFSISWPRIIPTGIKSDHINEKGIQFYDQLIDQLLESKITPIVTLYHWDLPQVLQEKYGGWQNISMVNHFNEFANLCFERFGNRVKYWITFNNPWVQDFVLGIRNYTFTDIFPNVDCGVPLISLCPKCLYLLMPVKDPLPMSYSMLRLVIYRDKNEYKAAARHAANDAFKTLHEQCSLWEKIIPLDVDLHFSVEGYETGEHAPGLRLKGTGAYRAAHHIIKAHAKVWHSYDTQWRGKQKGLVGISLSGDWGEPVDISNQKDIEAAERYVQFYLGWFATPIFHGDYPQVMKDFVGRKSAQQGLGTSRMPTFSPQEKSYIKGTCDFLGIGHFTTRYITQRNNPSGRSGSGSGSGSYFTDRDLAELVDPRWPDPGSEWLYSVPWGFRRLLNFVKTQYGNPMIYVTENGVSEKMLCTELCDEWRIQYYKDYINELLKAIKDGVNVKGYTAWSLLDKFEWDEGYSERFGLFYVDFRNKNKPRYPKASVQFYKRIISSNGFPNQREVENWKRKAVETCSSSNQLLAAEEQRSTAANILRLIHDPLTSHMEMVTEIVVPTVCTLSILLSAIFLMFLLRRRN